jgi:hypothetical protein
MKAMHQVAFTYFESAEEAVDWQASRWQWGRSSDLPTYDDSAFISKDRFRYPLQSALAAFSWVGRPWEYLSYRSLVFTSENFVQIYETAAINLAVDCNQCCSFSRHIAPIFF